MITALAPNKYEYKEGVSYPIVRASVAGDYDAIPWKVLVRHKSAPRSRKRPDNLYPSSLKELASETKENLFNLNRTLAAIDPRYELDMKLWHTPPPTSQRLYRSASARYLLRSQSAIGSETSSENTRSLFTDAATLSRVGWKRSASSEDVSSSGASNDGPVNTCYLCSTLSEHQRHLVRAGQRLKGRTVPKPRIKYIAPKPRVVKDDEDDEVDGEGDEKDRVLYKIKVKTARRSGAGTKAKVWIILKGTHGVTRKKVLKRPHAVNFSFAINSTEEFALRARDVGRMTHLTVEHDGTEKKDSWLLEEVQVVNTATDEVAIFPCNAWLSRYNGAKGNKVVLLAGAGKKRRGSSSGSEIEYEVKVITGAVPHAATDANVYITLQGKHGESEKYPLSGRSKTKKLFEKGSEDLFRLRVKDIGPIVSLRIEHDNSGRSPEWFLEKIVIKGGQQHLNFPCGKWLARDAEDGKIARTLLPVAERHNREPTKRDTEYKIQVFTGDIRNAGTDANVFVTMQGEHGTTPKLQLTNKARNNFERGQEDTFYVTAPNIGAIAKLQIEHDNSGAGPGWFLDKIIVTNIDARQQTVFNCGKWLDKNEDDRRISRVLVPTSATRSSSAERTKKTKQYEVRVLTGDKSNAGTDANVFISLLDAQRRPARKHQLVSRSKRTFTQGKEDVFQIEAENIEDIIGIQIEHDNSGDRPNWFLEKVTVTDAESNKIYVFPCNKWLSQQTGDGKISRILPVDPSKSSGGHNYLSYSEKSQYDTKSTISPRERQSALYKSQKPELARSSLDIHPDHRYEIGSDAMSYKSGQPDPRYHGKSDLSDSRYQTKSGLLDAKHPDKRLGAGKENSYAAALEEEARYATERRSVTPSKYGDYRTTLQEPASHHRSSLSESNRYLDGQDEVDYGGKIRSSFDQSGRTYKNNTETVRPTSGRRAESVKTKQQEYDPYERRYESKMADPRMLGVSQTKPRYSDRADEHPYRSAASDLAYSDRTYRAAAQSGSTTPPPGYKSPANQRYSSHQEPPLSSRSNLLDPPLSSRSNQKYSNLLEPPKPVAASRPSFLDPTVAARAKPAPASLGYPADIFQTSNKRY